MKFGLNNSLTSRQVCALCENATGKTNGVLQLWLGAFNGCGNNVYFNPTIDCIGKWIGLYKIITDNPHFYAVCPYSNK